MKKKIIISAIVIVALFFGIKWVIALNDNSKNKVVYDTVLIEPSEISNSVTATGTVEPVKQVQVGTQVSGIIAKIYVDYNSVVKAGELIAEIDRSVLETELRASQAQLNASRTEYEYQTINYNRIKGLYEKELVSTSEYETAKYQYDKAQFSYQQTTANIERAKRNLSYTEIYSPINGVILSRAVDEGQTVAAGFSTPTLFTIAQDLKEMQVVADVDEADIGDIKEGQKVNFTVDAFPEDTFEGEIKQIRLQPTTTSNVVTYEVVINSPNNDLKLKPGLTANVTIFTLNKTDIMTVPLRALRFTPENFNGEKPEKCVWVKTNSETQPLEMREVKIGVSDGINIEITSGIKVGDSVVTGSHIDTGEKLASKEEKKSGNPFMPKRQRSENKRTK